MAASENPSPDILAEYVPLIAKGAGILFVGGLAGMALRYVFHVLVARELGVSLFGLFSLGLAFFSIADVTAGLGTSRGIVRYVALYQKERDTARIKGTVSMAARLCLTGGLIICFLSLAFSKPLAIRVFHSPQLSGVLYIFALAIPFSCLGTMFISALQGLKIMKYKVYARDFSEAIGRIIGVWPCFLWDGSSEVQRQLF
jgi:O-antigen/teichoic acid export membrane protein